MALEWPSSNRLKIDLQKWGILRFTEGQRFVLTAINHGLGSTHKGEVI